MTAQTPVIGQNRLPAPRGLLIDRSQPVTFWRARVFESPSNCGAVRASLK